MFPRTGPRLFRIHQGQALPIALLVYGALNAILYSGLLPLWEGFDEPFHYGYVQWLRTDGSLPVLGKNASAGRDHAVARSGPGELRSLAKPASRRSLRRIRAPLRISRVDLRNRLEHLASQPSSEPLSVLNYEAHQAPLAYAVLAPFDRLWADLPLTGRILRLRPSDLAHRGATAVAGDDSLVRTVEAPARVFARGAVYRVLIPDVLRHRLSRGE